MKTRVIFFSIVFIVSLLMLCHTAIADISVSSDSLDFGTGVAGKKITKTLTITNIGTAATEVTFSGLEGTDFSISGRSTVTIKPQKKYNLKITFKGPTNGSADEVEAVDTLIEDKTQQLLNDSSMKEEIEGGDSWSFKREATLGVEEKGGPRKVIKLTAEFHLTGEYWELSIDTKNIKLDLSQYVGLIANFILDKPVKIDFLITQGQVNCGIDPGPPQSEVPCKGDGEFTDNGEIPVDPGDSGCHTTTCFYGALGKYHFVIEGLVSAKDHVSLTLSMKSDGDSLFWWNCPDCEIDGPSVDLFGSLFLDRSYTWGMPLKGGKYTFDIAINSFPLKDLGYSGQFVFNLKHYGSTKK